MDAKKVVGRLLITAVILAAVYFGIKKLKELMQDTFANANGGFTRTAEAAEAERELKKFLFLQNAWCVRANKKYNTSEYQIPNYLDTTEATRISNSLIDAKSIVPGGVFDDSQRALTSLLLLENQVQVAQVTMAFYNTTGKNLGSWLSWLSNGAIVQARDYLNPQKLPTGVYQVTNGSSQQLQTLVA